MAGLLLHLTGCGIPRGVVWKPDSSGFFFRTYDGRLVQFDVNSRQRREILHDAQTATRVPAVSPDGSELALVQVVAVDEGDRIDVIRINEQGKETGRSPTAIWPPLDIRGDIEQLRPSAAIWVRRTGASPSDELLFWFTTPEGNQFRYGHYNFNSQKFEEFSDFDPLVDLMYADMSPIRPDGSGFLALDRSGKGGWAGMMWVDWKRWETPLTATPSVLQFEAQTQYVDPEDLPEGVEPPPPQLSGRLPITATGWTGQELDFTMGIASMRVAPEQRSVDAALQKQTAQERVPLAERRIVLRTPLDPDLCVVQVRVEEVTGFVIGRVELVQPARFRRLQLGLAPTGYDGIIPITRSPDGEYVAVTVVEQDGRLHTIVVNRQAEFLADFLTDGPHNGSFDGSVPNVASRTNWRWSDVSETTSPMLQRLFQGGSR